MDWIKDIAQWVEQAKGGVIGFVGFLAGAAAVILKIRKAKVDEYESIIKHQKEEIATLKAELITEKEDNVVTVEKCQREHKVTHELLTKVSTLNNVQRIEIFLINRARREAAKEIERLVNVIAENEAKELALRVRDILKEDIVVPTGDELREAAEGRHPIPHRE